MRGEGRAETTVTRGTGSPGPSRVKVQRGLAGKPIALYTLQMAAHVSHIRMGLPNIQRPVAGAALVRRDADTQTARRPCLADCCANARLEVRYPDSSVCHVRMRLLLHAGCGDAS